MVRGAWWAIVRGIDRKQYSQDSMKRLTHRPRPSGDLWLLHFGFSFKHVA